MVGGNGEALGQRGVAVVVQSGLCLRGAQQLGGVQSGAHARSPHSRISSSSAARTLAADDAAYVRPAMAP